MANTFASRMIINVLGIPGILLLVYLGRFYFAIFITLVCLLALREFYLLCRIKGISPQFSVGALACILISLFYYRGLESTILSFSWQNIVILLVLITIVFELFRNKEKGTENIAITLGGILYIPILLGGLIALRQIDLLDYSFGMRLTMSLFITLWVCDSAAYVFGKMWGKKKILERVSPKKTVTGCTAGLVSAILIYLLIWKLGYLESSQSSVSLSILDVLILGIIVGVFGQMGDFIESLIKRDVGVKDSSNFLLGHGGVLDRFDSLIVASPLTYLYLKLSIGSGV